MFPKQIGSDILGSSWGSLILFFYVIYDRGELMSMEISPIKKRYPGTKFVFQRREGTSGHKKHI